MAEHEIDHIGQEAAAMMKTMLQLATLVALRTRERGQKEAEARVKLAQVRDRERAEMFERTTRLEKARDPRNRELQKMIERTGVAITKQRAEIQRETTLVREQEREQQSQVLLLEREEQGPGYDSAVARELFALQLAEVGLDPELIELRLAADSAQAKPPIEAVREPVAETSLQIDKDREITRERERGLERDD